jgi:signal transduction histidine kinase
VHGEARHIEVSVTRFGDDIELAIRDDGRGFDVESARRDSRGLGLVSMEERVRTAGGEVMMWSKYGEGTTVLACMPAGAFSQSDEDMADKILMAPYGEAVAAPGLIRS